MFNEEDIATEREAHSTADDARHWYIKARAMHLVLSVVTAKAGLTDDQIIQALETAEAEARKVFAGEGGGR